MKIRARMRCGSVTLNLHSGVHVKFGPLDNEGHLTEDAGDHVSYGEIYLHNKNKDIETIFRPGMVCYLDITPIEEACK